MKFLEEAFLMNYSAIILEIVQQYVPALLRQILFEFLPAYLKIFEIPANYPRNSQGILRQYLWKFLRKFFQ